MCSHRMESTCAFVASKGDHEHDARSSTPSGNLMRIVVILLGKDSYRQEKKIELKHLVHGVLSIRIQDVRVLAVDKERPCQIAFLSRVS